MRKPLLGLTLALALAACTAPQQQPKNGGISGTATLAPEVTLASAGARPLSTTVGALARPVDANDWSLPHSKDKLIIVKPEGAVTALASAKSLQGLSVRSLSPRASVVKVPAGTGLRELAGRIAAETGAFVQPNYIYKALDSHVTPNDPYFTSPPPNSPANSEAQFYLQQIDAPGAWDVQKGAATVAVLDTGVQANHPDLTGFVTAGGKDFCQVWNDEAGECVGTDDDASDYTGGDGGHGTHTAGIIAASTDNGQGIASVTWGGKVLAIKVLGLDADDNVSSTDSIALNAGIRYAADQADVKVINMSLGVPASGQAEFGDALVNGAIDYADSKDKLMVAAAGNYNFNEVPVAQRTVFYPANNPKVIAVGAVDRSNNISPISAQVGTSATNGTGVELVAPGQGLGFSTNQGILSTDVGNGYRWRYGTSEAAPQVAAVAAMVRAKNTALTALQTRSLLKATAKPLGSPNPDTTYGYGLVQAGAAVRQAAVPNDPVPPPAQQDRTVYVYADRKVNGTFLPNDPNTGRTVVILPAGQRSVAFKITETRTGQPLPNGTYRIVACINENDNGIACDEGDIGGFRPEEVVYNGAPVTGADVTMTQPIAKP